MIMSDSEKLEALRLTVRNLAELTQQLATIVQKQDNKIIELSKHVERLTQRTDPRHERF